MTLIVTVTAVAAVVGKGILDLVQQIPIFVFMLFLLLVTDTSISIGIDIGRVVGCCPWSLAVMAVAFEDTFDLIGHVAEAVTLVVLLVLAVLLISWFAAL